LAFFVLKIPFAKKQRAFAKMLTFRQTVDLKTGKIGQKAPESSGGGYRNSF